MDTMVNTLMRYITLNLFKIAHNGWVYEQVCLAEMFKFSTNVIGKLAYIPCYVPFFIHEFNLEICLVITEVNQK